MGSAHGVCLWVRVRVCECECVNVSNSKCMLKIQTERIWINHVIPKRGGWLLQDMLCVISSFKLELCEFVTAYGCRRQGETRLVKMKYFIVGVDHLMLHSNKVCCRGDDSWFDFECPCPLTLFCFDVLLRHSNSISVITYILAVLWCMKWWEKNPSLILLPNSRDL